jgi:hypothetical protein
LTAGTHQVILQLVDTLGATLTPNKADTVNFTVDLTPPNQQTIYNIQYSTATPPNSPFVNTLTSTTGIVTALAPSGYFIQDGTGSWNGIYVYDNLNHPAKGDNITITGIIKEFYGYTEFTSVSGFKINSSGQTLPIPVAITGTNIADTTVGEPYEGVLVKITNAPCSKIANSYGEWQVFEVDTANVDDLIFHFSPVLATKYDITGVVYLTFSKDFIEPRDSNDVQINAGINEFENSNIRIYPNPVSTNLNITNMSGVGMIQISDILGKIIESIHISGNSASINTNNLTRGIYFITLYNNKGIAATRKFSKE